MRVLIAEDEPLEAEALATRLRVMGHAVVGLVYDGASAVAKAEVLRPDLILLDMRMPKVDGIDAAGRILAHRRVPIIMITGLADRALTDRAVQAGVVAVLLKPVDRADLEAAIARTARFADQPPPS